MLNELEAALATGRLRAVVYVAGKETENTRALRRNGKTRRWKRTPSRWEIPCKHGLKGHITLTDENVKIVEARNDALIIRIV